MMDIDKLTSAFINIRDKRQELSRKFKDEDAALEEQQKRIKRVLLQHCDEHGVDSVRTESGSFYRTTRTRYWTNDWESFGQFVIEHEVPELLEKRLNQTNVKQFMEEHPDVDLPGLNADSEYVINVRKR